MSELFASSRGLESRLRAAYRRQLERSPELLAQYKRHRRKRASAFARGARHLLIPLFWACVFYGMVQRQADVRWVAGIVALWASIGKS